MFLAGCFTAVKVSAKSCRDNLAGSAFDCHPFPINLQKGIKNLIE
jgi:hypothetical protein